MKAKDYAARYAADPTDDTMAGIARDMFLESGELIKVRHASTNAALFAIMDEVCQKWKAFCRIIGDPNLNPEGLELLMKRLTPEVWIAWKEYKRETHR